MSDNIVGYNRANYMPAQKVLTSQRTDSWKRQCVDAIIGFGTNRLVNNRTSRQNKQINYDLYNSKYEEEDFEYVKNPYGLRDERFKGSASKMQNYNIIRSKIELLKGEEIKRPFNFFVKGVNGGAVSAREEAEKQLILNNLRAKLYAELGMPEQDENGEVMELPDIRKYMDSEFMDIREVTANQILKYLLKAEHMEMKFQQGWEHALITAEEYYYPGIVNGEVRLRVVNPLNFDYDKDDDVKFIEDAQWCKEIRYMSVGSILDTYGEFLTDPELDRLDRGEIGLSTNYYGMQPGFATTPDMLKNSSSYSTNTSMNGIEVVNVCWKSWKKIGFLRWIDKQGEHEEIVGDDFILTSAMKKSGVSIEWRWINAVWEGTKIGSNIYVNVRELPNQSRNMDNPSECKLPYTGYIYNNTNSQATSILDLVKPHQYTYMIVWWRLEQELAKSKGKAFVMDLAQLPKTQGWTVEEWMYYFDNLGVAFINSMEEGREGDSQSISKFNQFANIDRSLSDSVRHYMDILNKLEQQVSNLTGVSPQREAQTSPSESATANQNAIVQSSHITEPYFYFHNEVKKRVMSKMLECAKYAYSSGKKIHNIVDEVYSEIVTVDGELFPDSDYGVFVTNSSKDNEIKQKIEGLYQIALQQEKTTLSDIIKGYNSQSTSELSSIIEKGEREFNDRQAKNEQANRDTQKQISDAQLADAKEARENDNMNKQLDRQNKLDVATLSTLRGKDGPSDLNSNGIPDAVESGRLALEVEKNEYSKLLEQQKIATQQQKDARDSERENAKQQIELYKQSREDEKFKREQDQQDAKSAREEQLAVATHKLNQDRLSFDIKKAQQDALDKKADREYKLKEGEQKMKLEQFKAKQKAVNDRMKAQADIRNKREKSKADIAAKKKGIKTKPKS